MTAPRVFVSYSRTEAPLVADLAQSLRGLELWIDYQHLVPGEPWERRLLDAVESADAMILLVSEASMRSEHVRNEWERARQVGTRIVLAIVEATAIPVELRDCEWFDLRWRYRWQVRRLSKRIRGERKPNSDPPPESGRRIGLHLGGAVALATVGAITSIAALWTIVIPLALVPLPRQLLRRDFDYRRVRRALLALPWAVVFGAAFLSDMIGLSVDTDNGSLSDAEEAATLATMTLGGLAFVGGWGTLATLGRPEVRRWMRPRAARPERRSFWRGHRPPDLLGSTTFRLDAAPEDARASGDLVKVLTKDGHSEVVEDPAVVLHLVSSFHDDVEIDPDVITVPVLLADPDDDLPTVLQRTQWVDLRSGLNWWTRSTFSRLLADRSELMRWLGTAPPHGLEVRPTGVEALSVAIFALAFLAVGRTLVGFGAEFTDSASSINPEFWALAALSGVTTGLALLVLRGFDRRSRWCRRRYIAAVLGFGTLIAAVRYPAVDQNEDVGALVVFMDMAVVTAVMAAAAMWLIFRGDVRRWAPA